MVWLIILSIILATANNAILHGQSNNSLKKIFLFNFFVSFVWIVILLLLSAHKLELSKETLFYGMGYGVLQGMFLFFKMQAMATGPIGITTLLGNCSLILSTICGVVIWNESVNLWQILGVVLLAFALIFCTKFARDKRPQKMWIFYVLGFFVVAGAVGVYIKAFSLAVPQKTDSVFIISAVFMTFLYLILFFIVPGGKNTKKYLSKKDWIAAIACGIVSCSYNRLNSILTANISSIIFYPVFNGATILASTLCGYLFFKEKLSKRQILGLVLGIIALALISDCLSRGGVSKPA